MARKVLEVRDLRTSFFTHLGEVKAVDGVSFDVEEGEVIAIVGESGCGKSVTAMSIMGLVAEPGRITGGSIQFDGQELVTMREREKVRIRGSQIGMVVQDPMTSLNPVLTVGAQIMETLIWHQGLSKQAARQRAGEMLQLVGIPSPEKRLDQYPHQFSGGMRQRAMIAIALACNPKLLIADEPTTALDVTIQAQIMDLLRDLKRQLGTSVILITHDLGVVAGMAQRVVVMYGGKVVEEGAVRDIYHNPQHPYTWGLLRSIPRLGTGRRQRLIPIDGQPPDLLHPPAGCGFTDRCEYAMEVCRDLPPEHLGVGPGHQARCWLLHPSAPRVERAGA